MFGSISHRYAEHAFTQQVHVISIHPHVRIQDTEYGALITYYVVLLLRFQPPLSGPCSETDRAHTFSLLESY